MQYIAYYRVSTQRQGQSGLGLEAQRAAISGYDIVAEYTEIESGKKNNRPQLALALAHAKELGATLLIAKLDRLARNVHFITGLLEAGVPITCADMPEADRTFLQMAAVFAEWEGRRISERTKAALAQAKARGVKLGAPDPRKGGAATASLRKERTADVAPTALPIITTLRKAGQSLRAIASALNEAQIPSAMGGQWHASSVRNLMGATK
jgi:DNA invertase Pin-like site-specific DNA recombinase